MKAMAYQVKFKQKMKEMSTTEFLSTIKMNHKESMIICSCCGGIFSLNTIENYEKYPTWWISPPKFEGFCPLFLYVILVL